jgi:hypothetical protein
MKDVLMNQRVRVGTRSFYREAVLAGWHPALVEGG